MNALMFHAVWMAESMLIRSRTFSFENKLHFNRKSSRIDTRTTRSKMPNLQRNGLYKAVLCQYHHPPLILKIKLFCQQYFASVMTGLFGDFQDSVEDKGLVAANK